MLCSPLVTKYSELSCFPLVFGEGWSFTPGLYNSGLTEMCHAFGLEQLSGLVLKMELLPKSGSVLLSTWEEGHCLHQGFLLSWGLLPLDEDILLQSTECQCFSSGEETCQLPWLAAVLNSGFLG